MSSQYLDDLVVQILSELAPARLDPRADAAGRRAELAAELTIRPPGALPEAAARALDQLLVRENLDRPMTVAADLPRLSDTGPGASLSLWQGDITTLQIDAIVNAANNQMLGCFVPGHRCIDNVIHAIAGPGLRQECAAHMAVTRRLEPTGSALLTGGYHLPAPHVLHTVGPIVPDHRPDVDDAAALASCYRSCLDAAAAAGLHSVAFCAISTGVFGYPIELAAPVAVDAVTDWLIAHPGVLMHTVFNTFSDRDTAVYLDMLARWR